MKKTREEKYQEMLDMKRIDAETTIQVQKETAALLRPIRRNPMWAMTHQPFMEEDPFDAPSPFDDDFIFNDNPFFPKRRRQS